MTLSQPKPIVLIAGLLILGSLVSIWMQSRPPASLKIDMRPVIAEQTGLGETLAEETAQAVHDQGRIVLVSHVAHTPGRIDYCWDAFQRELQKHKAIRVVATEIVPYDPVQNGPVLGCSHGALQTLLDRHAQTDALVFFIALPRWTSQLSIPAHLSAKIIVLDQQSTIGGIGGAFLQKHYNGYFTSGLLSALILPSFRSEPPAGSLAPPLTPREWFDQHYQVYTPQNFDTLPE